MLLFVNFMANSKVEGTERSTMKTETDSSIHDIDDELYDNQTFETKTLSRKWCATSELLSGFGLHHSI